MGGLFLALALNALAVSRVTLGRDDGAVTLGVLLLAAITRYLFVENFQPR